MPEDLPDRMPEDMSDRMPEDLPVRKCKNVTVGITRSKVISWSQSTPCVHFTIFFCLACNMADAMSQNPGTFQVLLKIGGIAGCLFLPARSPNISSLWLRIRLALHSKSWPRHRRHRCAG